MFDGFDEIYLQSYLSQHYDKKNKEFSDIIAEYNNLLLVEYKRRFPFHFISQYHIKVFLDKLESITLLPNKENYIWINMNREIFDMTISITLVDSSDVVQLNFPYSLDIHKVTEYVNKKKKPLKRFNLSDLEKIINPECFVEFDSHMFAKQQGIDLLDDIKADNPIIVLHAGGVVANNWLINGTHRTIQAIRDGKETIEGYLVYPDICHICGISEGYEILYKLVQKLYTNLYGVYKEYY